MRINEIFDDPMDDEKTRRQKQLQASLAQLQRQYAPPSPEVLAHRKAKNAEAQERGRQHEERRKRVEMALEPIASKFKGDQFEEFKREAEALIPPEELKTVDLQSVFSFYNPDKKREHEQSWIDYGKEREKSAREGGSNPQIHGMGPTGHRNWTGD